MKIPEELKRELLRRQGHGCAICGKGSSKFYPDADPIRKVVHGLLCVSCKFGLGYFKAIPEMLEAARDYLETRPSIEILPEKSQQDFLIRPVKPAGRRRNLQLMSNALEEHKAPSTGFISRERLWIHLTEECGWSRRRFDETLSYAVKCGLFTRVKMGRVSLYRKAVADVQV